MSENPKGGVMMVLNRKHTLATNLGHSVAFEKDVPVFVPSAIYSHAIAIGAAPADGSPANVLQDEAIKRDPTDPKERSDKILAVIKLLVEKNDSSDFAASGIPHYKVVTKQVGFKTDDKEIRAVWQRYNEERAEAA